MGRFNRGLVRRPGSRVAQIGPSIARSWACEPRMVGTRQSLGFGPEIRPSAINSLASYSPSEHATDDRACAGKKMAATLQPFNLGRSSETNSRHNQRLRGETSKPIIACSVSPLERHALAISTGLATPKAAAPSLTQTSQAPFIIVSRSMSTLTLSSYSTSTALMSS